MYIYQIYVIKQYWRPYSPLNLTIASESMMYTRAGVGDRIIASEDLKIDGKLDSTLEFIRKGLQSHKVDLRPIPAEDKIRYFKLPPSLLSCMSTMPRKFSQVVPIISRVHCRSVQELWGFPIKFFKDLKELLSVMLDSVRGMFH